MHELSTTQFFCRFNSQDEDFYDGIESFTSSDFPNNSNNSSNSGNYSMSGTGGVRHTKAVPSSSGVTNGGTRKLNNTTGNSISGGNR